MNDHLHIVCLDAPAPPDYGGAIDMYYKITALAGLGKKIILHYFNYNKRNADSLTSYCVEINSYKRKNFARSLSFISPYIVSSRINHDLIKRLNEDHYPVLLEGLHCSGITPYLNDQNRVVLRMHNDESNYYKSLASIDSKLFRKIYFSLETILIKKYQKGLNKNVKVASLSEKDIIVLAKEYGFSNLHFIPCFIPWQALKAKTGKGDYCLYHGNMAIAENESAAVWLINEVLSKLKFPLVVAGRSMSKKLISAAKQNKNCRLIIDPPIDEMNSLIRDAHINILPSKNNTGVKLKLLHALIEGRFCITNTNGIAGSQIQSGVNIANEPEEYAQLVEQLFKEDFTLQHSEERQHILTVYNNKTNAQKLSELW